MILLCASHPAWKHTNLSWDRSLIFVIFSQELSEIRLFVSQRMFFRFIVKSKCDSRRRFEPAHMVELLPAGFENSPPMPEVEFHTALCDSKLPIQEILQKDPSIWPRLMRRLAAVQLPPPPLISCMDLPMQK